MLTEDAAAWERRFLSTCVLQQIEVRPQRVIQRRSVGNLACCAFQVLFNLLFLGFGLRA